MVGSHEVKLYRTGRLCKTGMSLEQGPCRGEMERLEKACVLQVMGRDSYRL